MTFLDSDYREIITKAVCGRGRKFTKSMNHVSPSHKPSSILGCWVINHRYHAKKKSLDEVEVHGSYDINIWYSFNDNTKTEVVTETIDYCDEVELSSKDDNCLDDDYEIVANVLQQPNCLQCKIEKEGNQIAVEVEREFVVKVIGETKVNVKVSQPHHGKNERHKEADYKERTSDDFIKGPRK